jgi:hypothetical protein
VNLKPNELSKLYFLAAQLVQEPARFDRLLKITREAPVKPSTALETHLSVIERTFKDQFVRNSTRDRKVLRKLALDLEHSADTTEHQLGQMFSRYIGGGNV